MEPAPALAMAPGKRARSRPIPVLQQILKEEEVGKGRNKQGGKPKSLGAHTAWVLQLLHGSQERGGEALPTRGSPGIPGVGVGLLGHLPGPLQVEGLGPVLTRPVLGQLLPRTEAHRCFPPRATAGIEPSPLLVQGTLHPGRAPACSGASYPCPSPPLAPWQ